MDSTKTTDRNGTEVELTVSRVPHSHDFQFIAWYGDSPYGSGEWFETPEEAMAAGLDWTNGFAPRV